MLLAAGRGERMEPLSSLIPKPALDVLGKPLLASAFDHLVAAGCTTVVVNLHRHPHAVAAAARASAAGRLAPIFSHEPALLGSAGGIAAARKFFAAGPLLVANADVWGSLDLSPLLRLARPDRAVLGLLPHPNPARWSAVELGDDNAVRRIVPPGGTTVGTPHLFTGFQLLGDEVLASLPPPPADMASVWRALIRRRALLGAPLRGAWQEAGTPGGYRELVVGLLSEIGWRHPGSRMAPNARLHRSAAGADCVLGAGTVVLDSVLTGGARVAAGVRLERCVVAGEVEVAAGLRLSDLLVLPGSRVPLL